MSLTPQGLIAKRLSRRLGRTIPVVQLWTAANVALLAGRHLAKLDGAERRRLVELVRRGHGRPSRLNASERAELHRLVTKLEPRLFLGSAASRLSPAPLPDRLLYGKRGSAARQAAARRRAPRPVAPA